MTKDNKVDVNYKCCKGIEKNGTWTVFTYCVDTSKPDFTMDNIVYNYDCRMDNAMKLISAGVMVMVGSLVTTTLY